MANQITIDIGAAANDGTGDPLRTAFNYVNNNFSNVWNTGLPNSNVQFSDNRILTVNTNANLVLSPNGIGKVASNVDIVPNTANVFGLGSPTRRWNTVYGQYLDLSHNATIGGNLVVTGNLSAGNISYTSNVFVGDLEGSVFDGASSIVLDVIDSAIYVDNYRYANGVPVTFGGAAAGSNAQIQFNDNGAFGAQTGFNFNTATNNLVVPGNIITTATANLGSTFLQWDNVFASNVNASNNITTTGNISAGNISAGNVFTASTITSNEAYINTGTFSGDTGTGNDSLYVGAPTFTVLGTDIMAQFTGNVTNYGQINFQNYSNSVTASGDYIITADNGNDSTHYIDMGMTSSTWDGSQTNVLDGLAPNNGYLYVQDGNLTLGTRNGNTSYTWNFDTSGNLTVAGNVIFADNYVYSGNTFTSPETNGILKNFKWEFSDLSSGADTVTLQWNLLDTTFPQWYLTTNSQGNTYVFDGDAKTMGFLDNSVNSGTLTFGTAANNGAGSSNDIELTTVTGNAYVRTGSNSWKFDNTGNLNLPAGGSIIVDSGDGVIGSVSDDLVISWDNEEIRLVSVQGSIEMQADNAFRVQTNYDGGTDTYLSRWEFNQDEIVNITGPAAIVTEAGDLTLSGGRNGIAPGNVTIQAVNNVAGVRSFDFSNDGNLTLPLSGNLVGATPNNNGYLSWFGNSSGDGNGYTTMRLVPDDTREGSDQYLIIDPTAPGHIHIRAGGTQDNSGADLFLGGENSYFRVNAGSNSQTQITSNSNTWVFNTDGNLQVPGSINGDNNGPLLIDGNGSGVEGYISLPASNFGGEQIAIVNKFSLGNGIRLETNGGNLFFGDDGVLTVPGNIVMPPFSSLVGNGASPAPSISGFNNGGFGGNVTATGNVSGGNLITTGNVVGNVDGYEIGYRIIPQLVFAGDVQVSADDAGKHFYNGTNTSYTVSLVDSGAVTYPVGMAVTIVNKGTGNISVNAFPGVSLYLAGNVTAGNRVVGTYGMATLLNVATDIWMINGTGVS